jgi:hypothetical protein
MLSYVFINYSNNDKPVESSEDQLAKKVLITKMLSALKELNTQVEDQVSPCITQRQCAAHKV